MARVTETLSTFREVPGTTEEVVGKLTALGWVVAHEQDGKVLLSHELIPGATCIVSPE